MGYIDVTHTAVRADADLRTAEAYYVELFDLAICWREPVPDGAPFDLPWHALDVAGVSPEIVMLQSGAFRLAVTSGQRSAEVGPIEHVGLQVTVSQLQAVRARALAAGYAVVGSRDDEMFDFIDRFGVEWELDTRSFTDPLAIMEAKRRRMLGA